MPQSCISPLRPPVCPGCSRLWSLSSLVPRLQWERECSRAILMASKCLCILLDSRFHSTGTSSTGPLAQPLLTPSIPVLESTTPRSVVLASRPPSQHLRVSKHGELQTVQQTNTTLNKSTPQPFDFRRSSGRPSWSFWSSFASLTTHYYHPPFPPSNPVNLL